MICLRAKSSIWVSNISRSPLRLDLNILILSSTSYRRIIPSKGFLFEVEPEEIYQREQALYIQQYAV